LRGPSDGSAPPARELLLFRKMSKAGRNPLVAQTVSLRRYEEDRLKVIPSEFGAVG
jgi:hypothetical protein